MEPNILDVVYKAEVYTNVTKPAKPVSFFMALIDKSPQASMLLIAAVLALFVVLSCMVLAERFCRVFEHLYIFYCVLHENFWRQQSVRYLNFAMSLSCFFALYFCAITGLSWWLFHALLLLQITFVVFRCRVAWINYNLKNEELEQVFVQRARRERPNLFGGPSQRLSEEPAPRSGIRRLSKPKIF